MARLPPPAGAPASLRSYGLLAHAPDVLAAFMDLYGRLWRDGVVPQSIKEVARLRNARLTGCGYCRNVRFAAHAFGLRQYFQSTSSDRPLLYPPAFLRTR